VGSNGIPDLVQETIKENVRGAACQSYLIL
jgi:hypothetical protein